jgi:phage terminase small subunit
MAEKYIPRCPAKLGARGRALWRQVHRDYELDAVETEILRQMCNVADRCDQIAEELTRQPLMTPGVMGQPRPNPLLAALRQEEVLLDRLASTLGVSKPNQAGGATRGSGAKRKAAQVRWDRVRKNAAVTAINKGKGA